MPKGLDEKSVSNPVPGTTSMSKPLKDLQALIQSTNSIGNRINNARRSLVNGPFRRGDEARDFAYPSAKRLAMGNAGMLCLRRVS